jgi:hypothetical protein
MVVVGATALAGAALLATVAVRSLLLAAAPLLALPALSARTAAIAWALGVPGVVGRTDCGWTRTRRRRAQAAEAVPRAEVARATLRGAASRLPILDASATLLIQGAADAVLTESTTGFLVVAEARAFHRRARGADAGGVAAEPGLSAGLTLSGRFVADLAFLAGSSGTGHRRALVFRNAGRGACRAAARAGRRALTGLLAASAVAANFSRRAAGLVAAHLRVRGTASAVGALIGRFSTDQAYATLVTVAWIRTRLALFRAGTTFASFWIVLVWLADDVGFGWIFWTAYDRRVRHRGTVATSSTRVVVAQCAEALALIRSSRVVGAVLLAALLLAVALLARRGRGR